MTIKPFRQGSQSFQSSGWSNWSGIVRCEPALSVNARTVADVQRAVEDAARSGRVVRPIGSGHSFSPLAATSGVHVALSDLRGVVSMDRDRRTVVALAGTKISQLGEPLWRNGLSLINQGDVDVQTLAGAIGTGTHGTGVRLQSLSANVVAVDLVLADGTVGTFDRESEPEVVRALAVSLGTLGVFTAVTLRVRERYVLRESNLVADPEDCLASLPIWQEEARSVEFFWLPRQDRCVVKKLSIVDETEAVAVETESELPPPGTIERYLRPERTGAAYRIFPSIRSVPFNEMEFAVDLEVGADCFRELRTMIRRRFPDLDWAVEYRTLGADDSFLSQSAGRDACCISLHEAAGVDPWPLFREAQAVFGAFRGRPHWGKCHSLDARQLCERYPEWERFLAVRERLDPGRRFSNDHLTALFDR